MDFRPGPGQVALVEYPGAQEPMTGLVTNGHEAPFSPWAWSMVHAGWETPPPAGSRRMESEGLAS